MKTLKKETPVNKITEYIYFDKYYKNIIYTSRNKPLKYEDQTPCIKLQTEQEIDMDKILELLNLN